MLPSRGSPNIKYKAAAPVNNKNIGSLNTLKNLIIGLDFLMFISSLKPYFSLRVLLLHYLNLLIN